MKIEVCTKGWQIEEVPEYDYYLRSKDANSSNEVILKLPVEPNQEYTITQFSQLSEFTDADGVKSTVDQKLFYKDALVNAEENFINYKIKTSHNKNKVMIYVLGKNNNFCYKINIYIDWWNVNHEED